MPDIYCHSFVEDEPSAAVARKLVANRNAACSTTLRFRSGSPIVKDGYGPIKKLVPAFLNMARSKLYTFILTDLDTTDCPPTLIRDWFSIPQNQPIALPQEVVFRVPVREVESWLLADRDAFAGFMGISKANFASRPDELADAKEHLLNVIDQKCRRRWQREMLPQAPTASIGPLYNEKLCEFIREKWNPARAATNSPSLARAIEALKRL